MKLNQTQFVKPESLRYIPDSTSSSSGSDGEGVDINGLTVCATKLGEGATLYLQTMKTMMIMFFLLSFINIPILLMYQSNTSHNNYLDIYASTFRFFTLGNMGLTNEKCGYSSMRYEGDHHRRRRRGLDEEEVTQAQLKCPD